MKKSYYDKKECLIEAQEIFDSKKITGMTVQQIAEEIYTHAFVFLNFHILPSKIRETNLARRMSLQLLMVLILKMMVIHSREEFAIH